MVTVMTFDANVLSDKFSDEKDFLNRLEGGIKQVLKGVEEGANSLDDSVKLMNSYLYSYPHMVKYFDRLYDKDEKESERESENYKMREHELVGALFMVYGWMPIILRFDFKEKDRPEELSELLLFLSKLRGKDAARIWEEVDKDQNNVTSGKETEIKGYLQILKEMLGGSVVGLSKFLHFVNPYAFPMYDSNVSKALRKRVADVESYIRYAKSFDRICEKFHVNEICDPKKRACLNEFQRGVAAEVDRFNEKFRCETTPVRAVEFVLFLEGREIKRNEAEARRRGKEEERQANMR